jgi:hypothetical protein
MRGNLFVYSWVTAEVIMERIDDEIWWNCGKPMQIKGWPEIHHWIYKHGGQLFVLLAGLCVGWILNYFINGGL